MKFLFQIKDWNLLKLKFKKLLSLLIYDSSLSSQANCATTGSYWFQLLGFHWEIVRNFLRNFVFSFFFHFMYIGTHITQNAHWKTALQSPHHYGHFLPPSKMAIHFLVKKTLLIWSICFGPLVTILMVFHCMTEKCAQNIEYLCNTITVKAHIASLFALIGATIECDHKTETCASLHRANGTS